MADPEEESTTEEAAPKKPKSAIRHFKGVDPIVMNEVREFAGVMKEAALGIVDDQAKEVLSLGVRRAKLALSGFLAGAAGQGSVTTCKAIKKDGTVCGRAPCGYKNHGDN